MNWSSEQCDILNHVLFEMKEGKSDYLNIESVAGSGKTSLLVEAATHCPAGTVALSFNKSSAEELGKRMPHHVQSSTFHKYCLQFIRNKLGSVQIDGRKVYKIGKQIGVHDDVLRDMCSVVGLLKANGAGLLFKPDLSYVTDLTEEAGLGGEMVEHCAEMALSAFKKSARDTKVIDFDDMLWVAAWLQQEKGMLMKPEPFVMLDEAQDTNAVQLMLLPGMGEQIISVGDTHQAIYAFRGAGYQSMQQIREALVGKELSMTYSWRCPELVAGMARSIVPHFKAAPDAIQGEVIEDHEDNAVNYYISNAMYLCRNNAPLFKIAIQLLNRRMPFHMSGHYPQMLISFVERLDASNITELKVRLKAWFETRKEELEQKKKYTLLEREEDKFNCIMEFAKCCTSPWDVIETMRQIMTSKDGALLSTIHGAKGLEAERVCLVRPELLPSKYARSPEQLQQEYNLEYVAWTRTKKELVMLSGNGDSGWGV